MNDASADISRGSVSEFEFEGSGELHSLVLLSSQYSRF